MSAVTTARPIPVPAVRFNLWRAAGVLGAVVGAVAVWAAEVPLLGIHLAVRFGSGPIQAVGIAPVVISALLGSIIGWGVLALAERLFRQGLVIWTGLAIAGLLASLSLPFYAGTTLSTKIGLSLMHLAVGAVLIPTLRRGATAKAV